MQEEKEDTKEKRIDNITPQQKHFVLTGGPGSGKSSIILGLELYHDKYVVREAAEDYIRLRQAEGEREPWTEPEFQKRILELQLKRRKRIHPQAEEVWYDREAPDGLGYQKPGTIYDYIESESRTVRYEKVFIIDPLEFTETTETRREDRKAALKLAAKMEDIYKDLGYSPIRIKTGEVKQRIEEILSYI